MMTVNDECLSSIAQYQIIIKIFHSGDSDH